MKKLANLFVGEVLDFTREVVQPIQSGVRALISAVGRGAPAQSAD
ncbi:hypothetical protein [Burkholderia sp. Ac-20365]|nr:hypothetical protein [Burkholderia sp. Ac-20365]